MKKIFFLGLLILTALPASAEASYKSVFSPRKLTRFEIGLNPQGDIYYKVSYRNTLAVDWSRLGIQTRDEAFGAGFTLVQSSISEHRDKWKPVWGEVSEIEDNYNELFYALTNKAGRLMNLRVRVYDDGVGFRYDWPAQNGLTQLVFLNELTEFDMAADHLAWWIPGDWDSNEHVYSNTRISGIDASIYEREKNIYTKNIQDRSSVQTPVTMRTAKGYHFSIHEAGLIDFPAMQLHVDKKALRFDALLVPSADTLIKSVNQLPFHTPWRAIILARDAADLLQSKLILNLNEPSLIKDPSFIKAQKYVGVWWEMHIGLGSWDYEGTQNAQAANGRRHGANTQNVKRYIDFAAKYGFDGVLVEGWNTGWKDWFGQMKEEVFDFTKPYPDFDIDELTRYAGEKGVRIIAHHETSSAVSSYERQMGAAYDFMKRYNQNTVKTGYVGWIIPKGEHHDGQWMVNHYARVAERTAINRLMLVAHESVRPTGLHRTYPNWLACEAARGNEFNAWSAGNPPEHECILPFTRLLGGPMDYTPGIFETRMKAYEAGKKELVHTTVAKQLALYVTMYSPVQMAADLPENYEKHLDVFQFIRDVPVDWDKTHIVQAAVGDYLTIARKQKGKDHWFIGSITDEQARDVRIKMDFLDPGKTYEATIYEDGPNAHWENNPYPVNIRKLSLRKGNYVDIKLAAGGGCAISVMAK